MGFGGDGLNCFAVTTEVCEGGDEGPVPRSTNPVFRLYH